MRCVLGLNVVSKILNEADLIGIKRKQLTQFVPNGNGSALAVAMLWLISVGGEDEVSSCHPNQPEHLEPAPGSANYSSTNPPRKLSCFCHGFLSILVTLLWGQTLPVGHFYSFP